MEHEVEKRGVAGRSAQDPRPVDIRSASLVELDQVTDLALALWPDNDREELRAEFDLLLRDPEAVVFLAFDGQSPTAFAQCQLRHDYVEGTDSSPVGYLEGIFVLPAYRGQGLGRALVRRCEAWAREQGCQEFASDCELGNEDSLRFHLSLGFEEVNRVICFRKSLQ